MADGVARWNFENRVVVVTEPASLRGALQVKAFAAAGATVLGDEIGDEASVMDFAGRIAADHGRLDALIINDRPEQDSPMIEVSDDEWDRLIATNVTGGFLYAKHLAPLMFPARYGKIVFTTGPESTIGVAGRAHVCAVRHAIFGFAKDLAIEVAQHQINVNVAAAASEAEGTGLLADQAAGDLAHTVLWLSSDASRFVTGSLVRAAQEPRTAPV